MYNKNPLKKKAELTDCFKKTTGGCQRKDECKKDEGGGDIKRERGSERG